MKRWLGPAAYAYSFLLAFLRSKPFHASVTAGDDHWKGDTPLLVIGNGRFHWPARVIVEKEETLRNSLLVYTPRNSHRLTLLRLVLGIWVTKRKQRSLLLSRATDSVTVMADPPQPVDVDGEIARMTPIHFRLARRALRVLVPGDEL